MPSTRRQKAKARKSREMDMMSDMDNLDVMLGNGSENPIEREIADAIEQSSVQGDIETSEYLENRYTNFPHENNLPRQDDIRQSLETFSNEFNLRLSQEMDSMMSMVHSQINRAISNAISERVIPEIQNIVSSMSSTGNRDTEASVSPNSQENRECSSGFKSKFAKKDSQSACDLRDIAGCSHYNSQLCSHTLNAGAKRSGGNMAMPQCCYLVKGAKRPSHTTTMLTSSNNNLKTIAALKFFGNSE